ncbi:MAG: hypothetical protein FWC81_03205 [Coriobacteriia bacterium]|nr:hypothetical protein [Coriobacteriia bacterium]MCL2606870.1 hypothetical protein [Coriobacteriia bacterium]
MKDLPKVHGDTVEILEAAEPTTSERLIAVVAYFFFFLPMISIPKMGIYSYTDQSNFVKYHAGQSLILFIANHAFMLLYGVALLVLMQFDNIPAIVYQTMAVTWVFPALMLFAGIRNASIGNEKPLPLIGKLPIKV